MSFDSRDSDAAPSKSELKRQAKARLELGRQLVELPKSELAKIPLSEPVLRAVKAAQGITQNVARKREIQYLGKLLREIDVEPIRAALEELGNAGRIEAARQHRLERWRDALIEEGDELIHRLARTATAIDRQQVRQLVLRAHRESEQGRPPAAARELFRVLREADRIEPLPDFPSRA
ncbi:MAG: ribosome biogenesis factor YjgA [Xanthomonadales bacterium]|nr:ribosome biogenesis factor YjgA [Xanthomonadales bacterium]